MQRALLAPLAVLGRARGYRARYPAYSDGAPEAGEYVFVDEWHVDAPPESVFVALSPVLRPLFRWNHAWAIARAREGLEPYARRRTDAAAD